MNFRRGSAALWVLAGTVVLAGTAARTGSAAERVMYYNGVPYHMTSHGWQVYRPSTHHTTPHHTTNNNARAANANTANNGSTRTAAKNTAAAPVNMGTEVQSLKDRHPALAATLPNDIKRLDNEVQPVVNKLPDVAQFGYYSTLEDYKTLSTGDQSRVKDALTSLSGIGENDRPKFIESASRPFDTIQHDEQQLQTARKQPHVVFFQIRDEVTKFNNAATAPTSKAAAGTTPAATPAATAPATTPAKKTKSKPQQ